MTSAQINRQFLTLINREVEKVAQARNIYPAAYVDSVILPAHEKRITSINQWRDRQVLGAFGAFGPEASNPYARRQAVNPQVAEITAIMNAAIAAANDAYKAQVKAINAKLNGIVKDANSRISTAKKMRDQATIQQLQALIKQAKTAAQGEKIQAQQVQRQSIAVAHQNQQLAISALNSGAPIVAAATPTATTVTATSGPTATADPFAQTYMPPSSTSINVSAPAPVIIPGSDSGGVDQEMSVAEAQASPVAPAGDFSSPFDFSWLSDIFNAFFGPPSYTKAAPSGNAPPASLPNMTMVTPSTELDVFDVDPWTGGSNVFGNYVIKQLNRSPVVPARAVGFGQWTQLAGAVIQAGAQVGAAALTPKPKAAAPAPIIMPQPQRSSTSWVVPVVAIVAGVGVLGLVVARRRRSRK